MTADAYLSWVRGTGLEIAITVFIFGMVLRLLEILLLGRKRNLAPVRSSGVSEGFKTIVSRSLFRDTFTFKRTLFSQVIGYLFHLGLFIALFFLTPHLELFRAAFGFAWPGLPTSVVDFSVVVAMAAMMAMLWRRLTHPVMKQITTSSDYLAWALTFLPLLTGYMAYHHLWFNYTVLLATHILSAELLLVLFPFTKLTHAFTLFIARWYNGMLAGERGVRA
jgi:nitrate reductase gamma subunit